MAADAFTFNGTDLSTLSIYVRQYEGLHRLASLEAPSIAIRNQDRPEPFWIARRGGTVTLAGSITGTSRSNFQANIISFKQLANPTKDSNNQPTYVALTWDQRANQRLMVYTTALDVQELGPMAGEWTWELERRDYWESTPASNGQTASVYNLLTANESNAETSADGFVAGTGGTPSAFGVSATDPYAGTNSWYYTNDSAYDGVITPRYIPVAAGQAYVFSLYGRTAAGALTVGLDIRWYDSAKAAVSNTAATASWDTTYTRRQHTGVAPATAVYSRLQAYTEEAAGTTRFDHAQFETGATATTWQVGTSNPSIYNPGDVNVEPDIFVTFIGTSANGIDFTINSRRLDYDTACAAGDVLRIDCRGHRVYKNGTLSLAGINLTNTSTAGFPYLVPGANAVTVTTGALYRIDAVFAGLYE